MLRKRPALDRWGQVASRDTLSAGDEIHQIFVGVEIKVFAQALPADGICFQAVNRLAENLETSPRRFQRTG